MKQDFDVDLVYLWVDGNDKNWQKEKEMWQEKLGIPNLPQTNDCRFVDNQELKFSLRSVEMYAPWINKIFIVTNGQVPSWLDTSHPKIKIITHEQIMPREALPTFNSEAIETCIANIPGLSEHFLYANDDMFFNRPVNPDFFFDTDGDPIVKLFPVDFDTVKQSSLYDKNICYSKKLIAEKFDSVFSYETLHNIDAYRKSLVLECKDVFKEEFYKTSLKKFREENSVQRIIFSFYQLIKTPKNIKVFDKLNNSESLCLNMNNFENVKRGFASSSVVLCCINDEENVLDRNRKMLKTILADKFYLKQSWELVNNFEIKPVYESSHSKAIVFAPDNNFFKYFSVTLQSLVENSKNYDDYDIIVFDSDISDRNKSVISKMLPPNFCLRFFDTNEYIADCLGSNLLKSFKCWSVSMYYRIFIPLLMPKYEKVLYLDSDVVVNDDIDKLFQLDFEGNEIIAVADHVTTVINQHLRFKKHVVDNLNFASPEKYFNSGVILFNIKELNTENYLEKFKHILNTKNLFYPDQDILNFMFENKTKLVHAKFNYQNGIKVVFPNFENMISGQFKQEFLEAQNNPVVIHYTTESKPWKYPHLELSEVFWKYAKNSLFFAEIICLNFKGGGVPFESVKHLNLKWKIYYEYYRSKILAKIFFGSKKKHYELKRDNYKRRVKDIRRFSKL